MSNYSIGSIPLSIINSKTHAIKENGKAKVPDWLETGWLLSQFAKGETEAIKNYKNFVEKIDIQALENPEKDLTGGFILGTPDFVNWVKEMM